MTSKAAQWVSGILSNQESSTRKRRSQTVMPNTSRVPDSINIDPTEFIFTKRDYSVFAMGVTLFLAVRLWHLTAFGLWGDEIFSIYGARRSWGGLFTYVIKDVVHPPLFYLVLKLWIGIGGESMLWLRMLPVLISTAAIIPFFLLCRELNLRASEIKFALVLVALNGYMTYYAQEIRMYSLLQLLTLFSVLLFVRFIKSEAEVKGKLMALWLINLLLIYTHYFGWLVVGTEFIFLFFWKRKLLLRFAVSVACLAICFVPWAYAVAKAAALYGGAHAHISWVPRPQFASLVSFYGILNGALNFERFTYVGLALFGCPIAIWAWTVVRRLRVEDKGHNAAFWLLITFSFLPAAITYVASKVLPESAWVHRYLIIVAAPYMIMVAAAAYRLRPYWIRIPALVLLLSWAALSGFEQLRTNCNAWDGSAMGSRIAWDPLMRQLIQAEPSADDILILALETSSNGIKVGYYNIITPVEFYSESVNERRFQVMNIVSPEDLNRQTMSLIGRHFWLAVFDFSQTEKYRTLLERRECDVGNTIEVAGASGKRLLLISASRQR